MENTANEAGSFWLGQNTLRIPMALHKENRDRLRKRFVDSAEGLPEKAFILLQGGEELTRHDTDHEPLFRQESYFHWAFGVVEPGFYGVYDLNNNKSILFIPRLPEAYAVWMGAIEKPEAFQKRYEADSVYYVDELDKFFSEAKPSVIYTLYGLNSDSGNYAKPATFEGIEKYSVDKDRLHPEIVECRVIKTPAEVEVLRYACKVSSEAHKEVMRKAKAGMMEYQLESIFKHHAYYEGGCRNVGYTCICPAGARTAVLHYGHAGAANNLQIKEGQMLLLDMGAEYHCYGADITCSYPENGKFTEDQKIVYNTVLAANRAVMAAMKPGVLWPDMHILAEKVICEKLLSHGLLRGNVDDMLADGVNIGAVFMPHGLGHLLGVDTHDPGGYPKGVQRATRPGLKSLRMGRPLEKGMVVTVEPGVYFIDALLEPALADPVISKFLVPEVIARFRQFGGVRIEDDVLVTETGIDLLNDVPRTVEEIESWMDGK
eukprot:TRINITY_DN5103_c0_g1_i2.p1 TRINITY_DN5103_c0_g1~~TRINITY_DN5103_c0_g1_i2.p1  ORF type:complete len:488 (+),score=77.66 TRINITY_DN5103_c0_g1_i2:15-1478(+)